MNLPASPDNHIPHHQILARKWRPGRLEEVVGQDHILRCLKNALNRNTLHSAYLFTGTRGVGKTTVGRIFAKALSCEQGISATPCDQCQHCQAIRHGQFPDLFEIDAASHTKVEDIRELLSDASYAPLQGRLKIYLIDEVHMLSNASFNALLKTLEEPPAHVIFILVTTDPHKIPDTVISRCLQFCLKPLTPEQIEAHLADILHKEKIPFETSALMPIAMAAKGSIRDALTLLNQLIAYNHAHLSTKEVCMVLGTIETDCLLDLLEALKQQDANHMMFLTQQLSEKTVDFQQLLQSLASLIYQLTVMKVAPNTAAHCSPRLSAFIQAFTLDELQKYYQILTSGQQDLFLSPTPKMGADMTLLRMLAVGFVKGGQQAQPIQKPVAQPILKPAAVETQTEPVEKHPDDAQIQAIMAAFNAKLLEEDTSVT